MTAALQFPPGRRIDLACLGRLGVDFYAQQFGARLEDARSMAMYLGGSSANQRQDAVRCKPATSIFISLARNGTPAKAAVVFLLAAAARAKS